MEKVDEKVISKVIAKSLGVKKNAGEILQDYVENDEELFEKLKVEKFEAQSFLGEDFVSFDGLSKDGKKTLADLCASG